MNLTEVEWQTMIRHTTAPNYPNAAGRTAPDVVMLTLAALVGDVEDVVASHADYSFEGPTRWRAWAITPSGIAHVEATFSPDNYDALEDRQRRRPGSFDQPVEPTAITTYLRPLRTLTSFAVTRVHHNAWTDHTGSYLHFTPLEIELAFGATTERIGIETWLDNQAKRDKWEQFVVAARQAATAGGAK